MRTIATSLVLLIHLSGLSQLLRADWLESYILPHSERLATTVTKLDFATQPRPQATGVNPQFKLQAVSAYAVDTDSGMVLYTQNATEQRPIASITKLASLLVLLRSHKLEETVLVGKLPNYSPDDAILGLHEGQKFSFEDMLSALLIKSANDAADALAIYDSKNLPAFTTKMNILVNEWGIEHTQYASPSGLIDNGNFSTAESLAKIAGLALSNATVRDLINTQSKQIRDQFGKAYNLSTTNLLLKDGRFHGIKTGYTLASGQSVVALARVHGHDVITVVLASPDRFSETTQLVNYLEGAYTWQ